MNVDDDRDLAGPAGLCGVAIELVEQALRRVPDVDRYIVASPDEAAADRTVARTHMTIAREQLRAAVDALLPYVDAAAPAATRTPLLVVIDGTADG